MLKNLEEVRDQRVIKVKILNTGPESFGYSKDSPIHLNANGIHFGVCKPGEAIEIPECLYSAIKDAVVEIPDTDIEWDVKKSVNPPMKQVERYTVVEMGELHYRSGPKPGFKKKVEPKVEDKDDMADEAPEAEVAEAAV